MGGGQSLLCALRLSDYLDSAGFAGETALLSQLLRTQGAAHLAALCAGAGRGLLEFGLVGWRPGIASGQGRSLAGLYLLLPESSPPVGDAPGHRADLVAGHRAAVLPSVGAAGALPAQAVDAGKRSRCRADLVAASAPSESGLDVDPSHPYLHQAGRHRLGQPAGAGTLHAHAQPALVAVDGPRSEERRVG